MSASSSSSSQVLDSATCWAIPAPVPPPPASSQVDSFRKRPESILLRLPDELLARILAAPERGTAGTLVLNGRQDASLLFDGQSMPLEGTEMSYGSPGDESYYYRLDQKEEEEIGRKGEKERPSLLAALPTPTVRLLYPRESSAPASSSSNLVPSSSTAPSTGKTTDLAKATNRLKAMREADAEKKRQSRAIMIDQSQFDSRGRLLQPKQKGNGASGGVASSSSSRVPSPASRTGSPVIRRAGGEEMHTGRSSSGSGLTGVGSSSMSRPRSSLGVDASSLPRRSASPIPSAAKSTSQKWAPSSSDEEEEEEEEDRASSSRPSSISPAKAAANQTRARLARAVKGKGPKGEELKKQQEKERRRMDKAREEKEKEKSGVGSIKQAGATSTPAPTLATSLPTPSSAKEKEVGVRTLSDSSKAAVKVRDMASKISSDDAPEQSKQDSVKKASTSGGSSTAAAAEGGPTSPKKRKRDLKDAEEVMKFTTTKRALAPKSVSPEERRSTSTSKTVPEKSTSPEERRTTATVADSSKVASATSAAAVSRRPSRNHRESSPISPPGSGSAKASNNEPPLRAPVAPTPSQAQPQPQPHHGPSPSASLATREPWLDIRGLNDWRHLVERHARVLKQYETCRVRLETGRGTSQHEEDRDSDRDHPHRSRRAAPMTAWRSTSPPLSARVGSLGRSTEPLKHPEGAGPEAHQAQGPHRDTKPSSSPSLPPPPPLDMTALLELVELQRAREGELKRMFVALDSFKKGWDGS
ncbi:hypothetical protein BCV69DRAFT_97737 [Microstroma glucosiphilum]|uniref:Uncharacterized protein n=1 Tax=Pseudomicrostroma glucosiphilum TaxID=1684307 RepID=A0A316UC38_9BASI|nr:hypothetical protein BCV69DRAFT_97737 [Pseudomicrostroma glucosiphilum]PWN22790.1 hypothetical protein BCV69DRAFT_97737 [Pseudomicrostroma glucosiphilum]